MNCFGKKFLQIVLAISVFGFAWQLKAADTFIRGQIDGYIYTFEKLETGDSLDLQLVVPSGEQLRIEGQIFDGEFFDSELTVFDPQGKEVYQDRMASSANLNFLLHLGEGALDERADSVYKMKLNFKEVFGQKDKDVSVSLRAYTIKRFDGSSYRDAGNALRLAEEIVPNTALDGYLASRLGGNQHQFKMLSDDIDFYVTNLLEHTDYTISVVPDSNLAVGVSLTDATGRHGPRSRPGVPELRRAYVASPIR